jgi:hypothetical protein
MPFTLNNLKFVLDKIKFLYHIKYFVNISFFSVPLLVRDGRCRLQKEAENTTLRSVEYVLAYLFIRLSDVDMGRKERKILHVLEFKIIERYASFLQTHKKTINGLILTHFCI